MIYDKYVFYLSDIIFTSLSLFLPVCHYFYHSNVLETVDDDGWTHRRYRTSSRTDKVEGRRRDAVTKVGNQLVKSVNKI